MSDLPGDEVQRALPSQQLRQSQLDSLNAGREAIEQLSEEELEVAAGGITESIKTFWNSQVARTGGGVFGASYGPTFFNDISSNRS